MRDLRLRSLWLALGLALVGFVFVLSVLPTADVPVRGFNDKINHVLGFVAMTLWFCALFERRRWLMVSGAMLALGILIEVTQGLLPTGRKADVLDLVADSAGIGAGVLLARLGLEGWPSWFERVLVGKVRQP